MVSPTPSPTPTGGFDAYLASTSGYGDGSLIRTPMPDPDDPMILWTHGVTKKAKPAGRTPDGAYDYHTRFENEAEAERGSTPDRQIPMSEAVGNFWSWSSEQRAAFGKRLYAAGIIDDPSNFVAMQAAWERAVGGAAASGAAGAPRTPWEIIDLWDGLSDNRREGPKEPTTQTSYNTPSRQEAEAMIRQLFRDKVGRDPDEGEMSKYRGMIIRKASDNPTVSRTVYDADGNATTTTSGGIDIQSEIQGLVQEDDDYGTFQAGTTYLNALMSALGAPV